jgi:hypothetical protein
MMRFRGLTALALAFAASATACSSSSGGSGTPTKFACASQSPTSTTSTNQACTSCEESMCVSEATAAYGSGYTSGDFSGGACASLINCIAGCQCTDSACFQNCTASMECTNALQAGESCSNQKCSSHCGSLTPVPVIGDDGGTMVTGSDAGTSGGGPTGACNMGASNLCVTGLSISACSSAGGTLMSTCPSAGLAGCCTSSNIETCFYAPLTAMDAMAACTSGTFSTAP